MILAIIIIAIILAVVIFVQYSTTCGIVNDILKLEDRVNKLENGADK